jgi:hypothetical protein
MLFMNNFFPIRVYYSKELDMHRLQAPLADRDHVVFEVDFLPASYKLLTTLYVLNPRIFPPLPLGVSMFTVYQNKSPPFQTVYLEWVAFPIMTSVDSSNGDFSFFAFTTAIPDSVTIYVRNNNANDCQIVLDDKYIANYFATTPFYKRVLDRDNFMLYVHKKPHLYWSATSECLCIPSSNPRDFATLTECQTQTYPKVRNITSFTGNSAIPLAQIRDQIYPQPLSSTSSLETVLAILAVFFSLSILVMAIFLRRITADRAGKRRDDVHVTSGTTSVRI